MNNRENGARKGSEGNRLIGWLVSYGLDENGAAFEIRAGRSLISSSPLNDRGAITISEESIASPHLALSATNRHTVQAQDIFSPTGSYLVKGSTNEERKISGPVEVEHGDWIRVGEKTRLQVCLIDGPRR